LFLPLQQLQEGALAAAHVEHARAGTHQAQNLAEVLANRSRLHVHRGAPPSDAMNPPSAAASTGSASRKASWPRSVWISTKLTRAPAAFSARTIAWLSGVGYSQSLVNENRQKRTSRALRNACASTPPCADARSK